MTSPEPTISEAETALTARPIRRGLPRVAGGDAWPAAAEVPVRTVMSTVTESAHSTPEALAASSTSVPASVSAFSAAPEPAVRRGLPRERGGEPWPLVPQTETSAGGQVTPSRVDAEPPAPAVSTAAGHPPRRGLPRVPGGDAWPPAADVPSMEGAPSPERAAATSSPMADDVRSAPETTTEGRSETGTGAVPTVVSASIVQEPREARAIPAASRARPVETAAPATQTADPAAPASAPVAATPAGAKPTAEVRRYRGLTAAQWIWRSVGGAIAVIIVAGILMLAARGLFTLAFVRDFVRTYPGDYRLPSNAPTGFPAWLGWQHFCNAFLILLIIRSGIQVRREQRPKANWTPRWNPARKISLTLWLHQSLDLLWIVNGVLFVVLLFATGQWMRVVPTSWSVFPNAVSAALHYASLTWPTDDGWVNYNSLQQLTYFATIFLAAPLAAVTGVRMSGLWPKKAERLSRLYPVELARAIHFLVMMYFVAFIVVHVALVFATGALRNLNHMYGGSDQVNWVGFWIFVLSAIAMAGGWVAARPLVVAPIASLFGRVGR